MTLINFDMKLEKYAETVVQVGLNVQKGQTVYINTPIEATDFVHKVVKQAYKAGAKDVLVEYIDSQLDLLKYELAPEEGLKSFPQWKVKGLLDMAEDNVAYLNVYAQNPELLKDIDPNRVAVATKAARTAMKEFQGYIGGGRISWAIVSVPTPEWAQMIFPNLNKEEAVEQLWDQIFAVTRINNKEPVEMWKDHISSLNERANYLNKKKYKKLHYSGPGTNLTIELPDAHQWLCAKFTNDKGTNFVPNLPTEEVFTIPVKTGVNGKVSSTKPLHYNGTIINNFSLTFKDGKVVDFAAEEGFEALKGLLETDEGASYLGEVALVPHRSPISNSNLVFYNTLYDENASCHLALGNALPICIKNGKQMSKEELLQIGFNDSITHVDFMIGSDKLHIDGETAEGLVEPIFLDGNWVI
ncbi:aminopeptidase [Bacillus sp. SCS-151]|uniref:aminopeptidase n=1 Tax=Nanhaiella sioensis TaxID=3115293 RepID=UPI00397C339D